MSSSTSFGTGTLSTGPLGTAPFFDVKSMIDAILRVTGHSSPDRETTKRAQCLQFLNNSYQEICLGRHWKWMHASYDISLFEPKTAGTISVTNGDETVTGTGTAFAAPDDLKKRFWLTGKNQVYHTASVASATSLELETKWAGDTETDATYYLAEAQYKLPVEVDQIVNMTLDEYYSKLVPLGHQELRRKQAQDPTRIGFPIYYSLIRRETDDDRVYMEVWPNPDADYNVHLDYTIRVLGLEDEETCYPIIPDRYRVVLYYGALQQYLSIVASDPIKAKDAGDAFGRVLTQLRNDTQLTDSSLQFVPDPQVKRMQIGRRGFMDRNDFGRWD